MPHVIQQTIVLTLEILPSGVPKCTAERATAAIAKEWLRCVGQQVVSAATMPTYQIYVRKTSLDYGVQIQILLCWIVLQAHRQEINDFERA